MKRVGILVDLEQGLDTRVLRTPGDVVLVGYWQSWKYFSDAASDVLSAFQFRSEISALSLRVLKRVEDEESVAIHVRRGDYTQLTDVYHVLGPEYYSRAARQLGAGFRNPVFFVFSDEPEWARGHVSLPGRSVIIDSHADRRSDWEDLLLMSRCKAISTANSSFSWWAAWLANTARGVPVATPGRWKRVSHSGFLEDLLPPHWIRVPVS